MNREVVKRPKNAPDISSTRPIKVISKTYFKPLDILFIMKDEIKNVITIDINPNNNFSELGKKLSNRLEIICE